MKKGLFVLSFVAVVSSSAFADTVKFKNGTEATYGSVERQGDQYCTYRGGGLFCFAAEDVVSVKKEEERQDSSANVVYGSTANHNTGGNNSPGGNSESSFSDGTVILPSTMTPSTSASTTGMQPDYNSVQRHVPSEQEKEREAVQAQKDRRKAYGPYSNRNTN